MVENPHHKMICSGSQDFDSNINSISDEVIKLIEQELLDSPSDVISLVFLLYDVPDTALQKLLLYQKISKDVITTNLNYLYDWVIYSKSRNNNWRHVFVEALIVCQLFGIVKKLGLNIPNLLKFYQPENIDFTQFLNPMKKALYKVCENINRKNLIRLKSTLDTLNIEHVKDYEYCELVILKLMSVKFINLCNVDPLLKILRKLPGLVTILEEIKELQARLNGEPVASSSPTQPSIKECSQMKANDFTDELNTWKNMDLNDLESDNQHKNSQDEFKTIKLNNDIKQIKDNYIIKDKNRIGVCLIINQENFYLSQSSIDDLNLKQVLDNRRGSTQDKITISETMSSLNLDVISFDDLDHQTLIKNIKGTIQDCVIKTDSIFMLVLMSHGVKEHIYAADCVKIHIDNIQKLLDSENALMGIPKVLIIQACQVEEEPQTKLVADSPNSNIYLSKSDYLIYWATASTFKAYRDEEKGSIFIQILCKIIKDHAREEHLYDIFTRVNNWVIKFSQMRHITQVPIFQSTLRKKLYLYLPDEQETK